MRVSLVRPGLAVVMLALTLTAVTAPAGAEERRTERTITVSAAGQVAAQPDVARISSGVVTEADTAREALAANNAAMAKVIASLKEGGIEAKDIQTSSINVEPRYTNPREGQAAVINGYRVSNQVTITARQLDKLGEVLDSLTKEGANQMGGLSFEVSKAAELTDEARRDAVAIATRRAKLIAEAAGATLGEVISISDDPSPFQPSPKFARMSAGNAVPIEQGTETLVARVTITWALK